MGIIRPFAKRREEIKEPADRTNAEISLLNELEAARSGLERAENRLTQIALDESLDLRERGRASARAQQVGDLSVALSFDIGRIKGELLKVE